MSTIQAMASSMEALTEQYRTITQNLAYASASGYRRRTSNFSQTLAAQTQGAAGTGQQQSQVQASTTVDFTPGNLAQTGAPLDLGLSGSGFFTIGTPTGPLYTRNGSFALNAQRQLVDPAGRTVMGEGGPIVLPSNVGLQQIVVSSDGQISAGGQAIGKLKIVDFAKQALLEPSGTDAFTAPDNVASTPATKTTVQQGFRESSNVNIVEELVGLITVSRMYEASVKGIQSQDDRTKALLGAAMR